jgi:hypothetical protein
LVWKDKEKWNAKTLDWTENLDDETNLKTHKQKT